MPISLKQFILNSKNSLELAELVSQLFDIEVKSDRGRYFLTLDQFVFTIEGKKIDSECTGTTLCFHLDTLEELEELQQKYQFIMYKNFDRPLSSRYALKKNDWEYFFEFKDFDGRIWKFSYFTK